MISGELPESTVPGPTSLVPNCAYVQLLAIEIDRAHDRTVAFQGALTYNTEYVAGLEQSVAKLEHELSETMLNRAFVQTGEPSQLEDVAASCQSALWRSENAALQASRSMLERDTKSNRLTLFEERRSEMYDRIDRHVRRWHRFGNVACYKTGDDYVAPIVVAGRAAHIAFDLLARRRISAER